MPTKKPAAKKPPAKRRRRAALGANGVNALIPGPCEASPEQQAKWDAERCRDELVGLSKDIAVAVLRSGQNADFRGVVRAARIMLDEIANPTEAPAAQPVNPPPAEVPAP
jgi:hypothetical protein